MHPPRVCDQELSERLDAMGAVLIEGPKAGGKTFTASQAAQSIIRLDQDPQARAALALNPAGLFGLRTPILFDEWQIEPLLWNRVRREVDDRGGRGLYILTGSAIPRDDHNRHSGAGRIGTIRMRPLSLAESGHSTGQVSLWALFAGETAVGVGSGLSIPELFRAMVIGGWPGLLGDTERQARRWLADYLGHMIEVEVPSLGLRRNPRGIRRLLESLARSVGQPMVLAKVARDVGGDRGPLAPQTLSDYLDTLDRLMLTDNSMAWRPHMRSKTKLRAARCATSWIRPSGSPPWAWAPRSCSPTCPGRVSFRGTCRAGLTHLRAAPGRGSGCLAGGQWPRGRRRDHAPRGHLGCVRDQTQSAGRRCGRRRFAPVRGRGGHRSARQAGLFWGC